MRPSSEHDLVGPIASKSASLRQRPLARVLAFLASAHSAQLTARPVRRICAAAAPEPSEPERSPLSPTTLSMNDCTRASSRQVS